MDGPTFKGLYGSRVTVTTQGKERTVLADDDYLRRSIVYPKADIVKGYSDIMPLIPVKPKELEAIVAYIRTLR
jgi:cytochrome c oxidase subunit 2